MSENTRTQWWERAAEQPESQLERVARAIDPEAWNFGRSEISGRQAHALQKARAVAEVLLTEAVIEAMAWEIDPGALAAHGPSGYVASRHRKALKTARAAATAQTAAILAGK